MCYLTADAIEEKEHKKEEAHKQLTKKKSRDVRRAVCWLRRRATDYSTAAPSKSASIHHADAENNDDEFWNMSNVRF
jgi:hypothetical protein